MQKKKSQNIIPISLDYEQDLIVHAMNVLQYT